METRASPARPSRARRITSTASSGRTPNFDPRCPVMIFSWPPASMPGVIRSSTRFTPNSTQRSTSPGSSITTSHASCSAANRSSSSDLLFPCTTHDDGGIPAASAYFISPSVETSAPMPSSHRIFMIGTFGNAFVP